MICILNLSEYSELKKVFRLKFYFYEYLFYYFWSLKCSKLYLLQILHICKKCISKPFFKTNVWYSASGAHINSVSTYDTLLFFYNIIKFINKDKNV